MSQFGESCRSTPRLFYQKHSFLSRAILLLHRLICCITWVASNLLKYALAKLGFFLLGLRASKSLGLPHPSLSAPQRRRKTPTWQMEDLLGRRKGEDMKTKSGKKYHVSNARSSVVDGGGAARQQKRFWGSHVSSSSYLLSHSLLSPLSSFHSRIPQKLIRLLCLSPP